MMDYKTKLLKHEELKQSVRFMLHLVDEISLQAMLDERTADALNKEDYESWGQCLNLSARCHKALKVFMEAHTRWLEDEVTEKAQAASDIDADVLRMSRSDE